MDAPVLSLTVYNGDLIAGGYFNIAYPTYVSHLARWDGVAWHGLGNGVEGPVYALATHKGNLIVAGFFSSAGNVPVHNIASWNGSSWEDLGGGTDNQIAALVEYDGDLVAAGYFFNAGGVAASKIARWDGESWLPLGDGMDGHISALTVYKGKLIAGGSFSRAGAAFANYLAAWDGATWQSLGQGVDDVVFALGEDHGDLIAAGQFIVAGNYPSSYWARYGPTGPAPLFIEQPSSPAVCANSTLSLHASATGDGALHYQWQKTGQDLADSTDVFGTQTDTLVFARAQPADSGSYTCVVKLNNCTQTTSNAATLNVFAGGSADGNADGIVDARDVQPFVDALTSFAPVSGTLCAYDLTGEGVVNLDDVPLFVARLLE